MLTGITLEELSEQTGVEARTLRSWIKEGLLAPPDKAGRGATYPSSNVDRAFAVLALKNGHGLALSEIGRRLMTASESQIRNWANEANAIRQVNRSPREYLRNLEERFSQESQVARRRVQSFKSEELPLFSEESSAQESSVKNVPNMRSRNRRQEDLASIELLIASLEDLLDGPAPRRSKGAIWTRVAITPDLELSIRGELEARERALFEQLADQFRAILTGGTKNE